MTIQQYLQDYRLITDGSFGTYYAERYETQEMPELANLQHADQVADIHKAYLEAGAKLLRTNTFAANTVLLAADWEQVAENIRAAVQIAKEAVTTFRKENMTEVFIAGDIGPIPGDGDLEQEQMEEQYYKIAKTFIEEGISILTFETFPDMEHILPVIKRIKQEEKELFIMVQFSVSQFGYSNAGLSAKKLLKEASAVKEIDAVGLNCGVGPGHMEQIITGLPLEEIRQSGKYMIALPNAGYPKRIRNRIQYANNPVYFANKEKEIAEKHQITILGGCCGTNPVFIKELANRVQIKAAHSMQMQEKSPLAERQEDQEQGKKAPHRKGFLYNEDGSVKTKKLIAVELAPPVDAADEKVLQAARTLQKADVDVLTFPDSPSGRTRIDSVLMAEKVRRETGMCVMPHICCRDKNAIAMRSLLLGAHINDIHNMLIITGDPVPSMARQTVKAVFNFDSVGLMQIAKDMNEENFTDSPLSYGGAINQGRKNLDVEIKRVQRKMEAGAEFFLSQPVFSEQDAERLLIIKEETGARILCGIMPLISRRNAMFMKNEIAGIAVSDELIERYPENATKEEGEAVGIEIACEVMAYTKDFVDGYYFSFPFNRVHMLEKIMQNFNA